MFGAPGSAACAAAAEGAGHRCRVAGEHCLLVGARSTTGIDSRWCRACPTGVSALRGAGPGRVTQGTVVLQAVPRDFAKPTPIARSERAVLRAQGQRRAARSATSPTPSRAPTPTAASRTSRSASAPRAQTEFQQRHRGDRAPRRRWSAASGRPTTSTSRSRSTTSWSPSRTIDFKQYPDGINGGNGADISGSFTITSAQDLANELRLGALPINLKLISESTGVGDARQAGASPTA